MRGPSNSLTYQTLLLQAADEGRGAKLFGESLGRARTLVLPFLIGNKFPNIYLEHPLSGKPFLDVTVLYNQLEQGMRIDSSAAGEHGALVDWFAEACTQHSEISFGFEVDTKKPDLPMAGVHFQPRHKRELVRPFCEAIGQPEQADLYLSTADRMPNDWPLSFFGMFRGRPDTPLRVCGYLSNDAQEECMHPSRLKEVFDAVGFKAYDAPMLDQACALLQTAPGTVDFQFDAYADGTLGPTFAFDVQFGIEQPPAVQASFAEGAGARVMRLLESWGAADNRWEIAVQSAFARSLPVELEDGKTGRFAFTLMPQWVKARWVNGTMQPSKLYHLANATLLDSND